MPDIRGVQLLLGQERGHLFGPGQLLQPLVDGVHLVPGEESVSGLCLVAPVLRVMMAGSLVVIVLSGRVHRLPTPLRLPLPLLRLLLEHLDLGQLEAEPGAQDVHGYLPPVRVPSHPDV